MGNFPSLQSPEKVWPNLGLDEHHRLGPDSGQGTTDKTATVDRVVNPADLSREFSTQLIHCGGGGCGDDQFEVGQPWLENLDELQADVRLTNTDSVQPDDVPVADGLLELGGITAQPLAKTVPPSPATLHS